jgi:hypothetical protein
MNKPPTRRRRSLRGRLLTGAGTIGALVLVVHELTHAVEALRQFATSMGL